MVVAGQYRVLHSFRWLSGYLLNAARTKSIAAVERRFQVSIVTD
jgi:hypothetical protein